MRKSETLLDFVKERNWSVSGFEVKKAKPEHLRGIVVDVVGKSECITSYLQG